MNLLGIFIDWAEVWILLVPLVVYYVMPKSQPVFMRPIITYLWLALAFNIICDGMVLVKDFIPRNYYTNTIIYNLHSVSRFACFSIFFFSLNHMHYRWLQKTIVALFMITFVVYFTFFSNFFNTQHISGDLMAAESFCLLFFCMLYYLSVLREENARFRQRKDFWVVTGIGIFCVINFFVFLFYVPLINENFNLADRIWDIHNIGFIIFILFLTKAIYVPVANKH